MKLSKIFFTSFFFLIFCSFYLLIALVFIKPEKNPVIISPVELFEQKVLSAQAQNSFWLPKVDKIYDKGIKKPEISALSVISYDLTSERMLYDKNIKSRYPIASLTKIMTAVIALENEDFYQKIKISKSAAGIGEDSMGLTKGEEYSLEDLMYGLILHSGNDAAEAIAESMPSGRSNFIYLMNKKAEDLGLSDTHFTNPTGLEGDGKQYSSVFDLLVITRYGLNNGNFAKIVSTVDYEIPYTEQHKQIYLFNETNLLTTYPGVKGVKTGYTDEAGLCLVTYLEYDGHKIIAILLNSTNRIMEMKDLLDYSLKTLGVEPPPHS
ncbi:MAG: hypothetical protein A2857_06785 [Candidatus Levybacteria bacterium RIFCSPHIGHO2_01_FULL_36_15]|nr:MAG: hypothetical protein A2857_06785 [Candidatus Levybacteria bacterium RIFCSPHIGHO2_01_FULL_36_15]OGH37801.1 MAG: hypothetical protein A2905_00110 [Candidatus Levybacteria bacterium RIFCSPLOWO2_01_FULL_36_10]